ncbi:uncharacterized protein LOC135495255 [Lineus longissimus]|uniref:uncharacterized protein LOC135495255 n=1 Tax=Lineus longissimus TaxID=88925 RepID=UPI00315CF63F
MGIVAATVLSSRHRCIRARRLWNWSALTPTVGSAVATNHNPMNNSNLSTNSAELRQMLDIIQLPKAEIMYFDGDPLRYHLFIRSFDNAVGRAHVEDNAKLNRLLQYCKGKALTVIECCAMMDPSRGYVKARSLLQERFGSNYVIAEAWISKVTEGPVIKPSDHRGLQDYADELQSCQQTLEAMGRIAEVDTQRSMVRLVDRLPFWLQQRWRKRAVDTLEATGAYPRITDLIMFTAKAAREANDPMFGIKASGAKTGAGGNSGSGHSQGDRNDRNRNRGKGTSFNTAMSQSVSDVQATRQTKSSTSSGGAPGGALCPMCAGSHSLFGCQKFKDAKPEDRLKFTRGKRLCDNCLKGGHFAGDCRVERRCTVCNKKHTKFLHIDHKPSASTTRVNTQVDTAIRGAENAETTNTGSNACIGKPAIGAGTAKIALPIVPVTIRAAAADRSIKTHALLDSGSTNTFCTEGLLRELGVKGQETAMSLTTLIGESKGTTMMVVALDVSSADEDNQIHIPLCYALGTRLPVLQGSRPLTAKELNAWPHLRGIDLPCADASDVKLLIGQDMPEALAPLDVRVGNKGEPYATCTRLGWALNGPMGMHGHERAVCNFICRDSTSDARLESQLKKFWEVENEAMLDDQPAMSVDDQQAIKIWADSICKEDDHFQLAIPFKRETPGLADNYVMAERRLCMLGKRLQSNPELYKKYSRGIRDLIDKGYAEMVPSEDAQGPEGRTWYLPHHPVFNEKKPDKCRIVFDCAAKFHGSSLNDMVLQGPDYNNSLIGVPLRFRQERVAVKSDIEAMFHQVRVRPADRDVLRFLWWQDGNPANPPVICRMVSHVFGGIWSPSCCGYALRQASEDALAAGTFNPETINRIRRSFYVDDNLCSLKAVSEAIRVVEEMRTIMRDSGFNLTKVLSNFREVLETVPVEARAAGVNEVEIGSDLPNDRALGVQWCVQEDTFGFKICIKKKPETRRGILSLTSSVFDPLGLASPCILTAKLILQELCRIGLGWDDTVPEVIRERWHKWVEELPRLELLAVDRCFTPPGFGTRSRLELHHFSDGSLVGHGAVSYLRMVNGDSDIHCTFVKAKAKLNPMKAMTIPRVELTAAVVAVKLDKIAAPAPCAVISIYIASLCGLC